MQAKFCFSFLVACAAIAAAAVPSIDSSSVSFTRNAAATQLKIAYKLTGGPAVVTARFFREGTEEIPESQTIDMAGDVNRLVESGSRKITWVVPTGLDLGDFDTLKAELKAWRTDSPPPYMVVHLTNNPVTVSYYTSTDAFPLGFGNVYYKSAGLTLRKIPAANAVWEMGDIYWGRALAGDTYATRHNVKLTEDYYIGVYEYTYGNRYAAQHGVLPATVTDWPNDDCRPADTRDYPVLACAYTNFRRGGDASTTGWPADNHEMTGLPGPTTNSIIRLRARTGIAFDLPTDAQWEFACRGDGSIPFYNGASDGSPLALTRYSASAYYHTGLNDYAWTMENSRNDDGRYVPHPVGLKRPNSFGLYDMLGNACEHVLDACKDLNGSFYETADPAVDPVGTADPYLQGGSPIRVRRGGGYGSSGNFVSCNFRHVASQTYTEYGGQSGVAGGSGKVEIFVLGGRVCCPAAAIK